MIFIFKSNKVKLSDMSKILGASNPLKTIKSSIQDERTNFKLGHQGNVKKN